MTTDLDGQRAFVMTLRAREQDIRRDKAASNICTNQALLALAASIYLAEIGPHGLRDVAATGAARAAQLEAALSAVGVSRLHPGPYLNEFAIHVPDARSVHRKLLERGVLAGLVLSEVEPDDPSLADALLVCATEVTTPAEIGQFARALEGVLEGRPPVAVEAGAGEESQPAASVGGAR
jgi:glycine dehydrogenase subunit 1